MYELDGKEIAKKGLEIASSIPIDTISVPANIIYNIANYSGAFDKEGCDKMTNKELFYDLLFDGTVIDEQKAKTSNCKCTEVNMFGDPNRKREMCWKPGILGVLTKEQVETYCPAEKKIYEKTEESERVSKFIEASDKCEFGQKYKNQEIQTMQQRVDCVMHELKKYNLDITEEI